MNPALAKATSCRFLIVQRRQKRHPAAVSVAFQWAHAERGWNAASRCQSLA